MSLVARNRHELPTLEPDESKDVNDKEDATDGLEVDDLKALETRDVTQQSDNYVSFDSGVPTHATNNTKKMNVSMMELFGAAG